DKLNAARIILGQELPTADKTAVRVARRQRQNLVNHRSGGGVTLQIDERLGLFPQGGCVGWGVARLVESGQVAGNGAGLAMAVSPGRRHVFAPIFAKASGQGFSLFSQQHLSGSLQGGGGQSLRKRSLGDALG